MHIMLTVYTWCVYSLEHSALILFQYDEVNAEQLQGLLNDRILKGLEFDFSFFHIKKVKLFKS